MCDVADEGGARGVVGFACLLAITFSGDEDGVVWFGRRGVTAWFGNWATLSGGELLHGVMVKEPWFHMAPWHSEITCEENVPPGKRPM